MMTHWWRNAAWLSILALTPLSCGSEEAPSNDPAVARVDAGATRIECDVGERPEYFVPGERATIVGCARLSVSDGPVELSVQPDPPDRFYRRRSVCVNPAYPGRGSKGFYIPAHCTDAVDRFRVFEHPRVVGDQPGVSNRYELVLFGTAPPRTRSVRIGFVDGSAEAAVSEVSRALARKAGASGPFSVYIAELPLAAACKRISVEARLAHRAATRYTPRRPNICKRARQ